MGKTSDFKEVPLGFEDIERILVETYTGFQLGFKRHMISKGSGAVR